MNTSPVVVRNCHELSDFHACVALQREIWGEDPLEVEPATMFVVAAHTGGQVLAAYAGDVLAGFVLAVAGIRDGQPYLHSHMAGVKDGFRDQGIGRKLKLFQREEALQRGIRLIQWTFDPLEIRNAHFNLNRLGAIARHYQANLYGVTTSPLHRGLRTDRLLAEWHLDSPRVAAAIKDGSRTLPEGLEDVGPSGTSPVHIEVPSQIPYGVGGNTSTEPSDVTSLQDRLHREFTTHFARGYAATSLIPGTHPAYVLTRIPHPLAGGESLKSHPRGIQ
jgi:predicted GNAT superfamily acetyltransferase